LNVLLENPIPIIAVGGLCVLTAGILFYSRRNLATLAALVLVLLATLAFLAAERMIVTDREQIETGVYAVMDAIEQNNVAGVLEWIDPVAGAQVRSDAEVLMPLMNIETANAAGTVEITLEGDDPQVGASRFRGFLNGSLKSGGARVAFFDNVEVHWKKVNDDWRIVSYTVYWNGQQINAVESARGNRPIRGQ
jgi:hypothetical protein